MLCVNKPKRVVSVAKRVVIPTGGVAVVEESLTMIISRDIRNLKGRDSPLESSLPFGWLPGAAARFTLIKSHWLFIRALQTLLGISATGCPQRFALSSLRSARDDSWQDNALNKNSASVV